MAAMCQVRCEAVGDLAVVRNVLGEVIVTKIWVTDPSGELMGKGKGERVNYLVWGTLNTFPYISLSFPFFHMGETEVKGGKINYL